MSAAELSIVSRVPVPAWLTSMLVVALASAGGVRGQALPASSIDGLQSTALMLADFVENAGQWATPARFVARSSSLVVRADPSALVLQNTDRTAGGYRRSLVRLGLQGAAFECVPAGVGSPLPGRCNFLLGGDARAWRSGVRRFAEVVYRDAHPGVDVSVTIEAGTVRMRMSERFAGALSGMRLSLDGIDGVVPGGSPAVLNATTGVGPLRLHASTTAPTASVSGSARTAVAWRLLGAQTIGLVPIEPPPQVPLVVDVQIEWATYLGGTEGEYLTALTVDGEKRVFVTGETRSADFPSTPGSFDVDWNGGFGTEPTDAFVASLEADGSTLRFATFLGGSSNERTESIAISSWDSIVVAGTTASLDYPTTPGSYKPSSTTGDGFISGLSPDGSALLFSTYLGGSKGEELRDLAIAPDGRLMVCGGTTSADFPTTPGTFDSTFSSTQTIIHDAFLAVLDASASQLLYGTYLGGSSDDRAMGVALLPSGEVAVTGRTGSPEFPSTPGAFDTVKTGAEGYVFVLDLDTSQPRYSTFLGTCVPEKIRSHSDSSVVVVGNTNHTDFGFPGFPATAGAFDTTYAGSDDGFVLKLDPAGSTLDYGTFLGGVDSEYVRDLVLDSAGRATIVGATRSSDFPTTAGAWQTTKTFGPDLFVTRLDADGSRLLYSTFWGGPAGEAICDVAVALDETLAASVGGASDGLFPVTPGSYDPTEPITFDAVVGRLTLMPAGAVTFGASTAGASGALAIGVTAMPKLGAGDFAMTCTSAPASSRQGLLVLSLYPRDEPYRVKGFGLWLEPSRIALLIPALSNDDGYAEVRLRLPSMPALAGSSTFWQFVWKPPAGSGAWWASNACELTFQP